jgi:NADPH:quinone reductase-like Zn-dependent oxidoreductase
MGSFSIARREGKAQASGSGRTVLVDTVVALVADAEAPGRVSRREVEAPVPAANEVVVEVRAVSLNRGEVRTMQTAPDGWRPGWDVAGVIVREASDGTGPPAGARVVGLAPGGGWAERVALSTDLLSVLPEGVNFASAATLPVAGLTALRALELADTVDGHAVAVTGASGGVGRFAIQLAAQRGARVDAVVSTPERGRPLLDLGAATYSVGFPAGSIYDVVLESVGGSMLAGALGALAEGGIVVTYGNSSGEATTFDPTAFYRRAGTRLHGFMLFHELQRSRSGGRDLGRLASMVADNHLAVGIETETSWRQAGEVIKAFWERRIAGKAVLLID